ncbi:PREDICTED: uncharacterized protein LOC105822569 [Propithecus coquereli]|uniref:uncharacterized protein LOC105822569 n=1 Tax=Propithecus coquereli TaxID=379532 RepID=UPI00063FD15A|nr:PREDICTED: uncharacterized protein LOC105822569 [Propithecus coquereli]
MAAAGGLWGCEDPGRRAAILEHHGDVLRARAPPGAAGSPGRWQRLRPSGARAEKHVTRGPRQRLLAGKPRGGAFSGAGPHGAGRPAGRDLTGAGSSRDPLTCPLAEGALPAASTAAGGRQRPLELAELRSAAAFRLLPDVRAAVMQLRVLRVRAPPRPPVSGAVSARCALGQERHSEQEPRGLGQPGASLQDPVPTPSGLSAAASLPQRCWRPAPEAAAVPSLPARRAPSSTTCCTWARCKSEPRLWAEPVPQDRRPLTCGNSAVDLGHRAESVSRPATQP